ncbi:MAG: alpha/beta fold hydrolase [Byssovorax sp.]
MPDPWLPFRRPKPAARLRLFCFPYASGGASLYRAWAAGLPADVEVCAVQLPGREGRIAETPITKMTEMVPKVADALAPHLDLPFVLFGHSMGSIIAFELCRELRRRKAAMPLHLIASGCHSPDLPDRDVIHDKPDEVILAHLGTFGGTSAAALQNPELMAMVMPLIRADGSITETYVFTEEEPLDLPLTVFGGELDPKATRETIEAWRPHSKGPVTIEYFPGDHFFLNSHRDQVIAAVSRAIRRTLP